MYTTKAVTPLARTRFVAHHNINITYLALYRRLKVLSKSTQQLSSQQGFVWGILPCQSSYLFPGVLLGTDWFVREVVWLVLYQEFGCIALIQVVYIGWFVTLSVYVWNITFVFKTQKISCHILFLTREMILWAPGQTDIAVVECNFHLHICCCTLTAMNSLIADRLCLCYIRYLFMYVSM